jgi:hypothetical protein
MLVKRLTMNTGTVLPTRNRALIKVECSNYCLRRAAKGKQSDNPCDKLLRVMKAIKGAAFGFGESLSTDRAFVTTLFQRVDANGAFVSFASGGAVHIRTKYRKRVQVGNPFRFSDQKPKRIIFGPLFYSKVSSPRFTVELPVVTGGDRKLCLS